MLFLRCRPNISRNYCSRTLRTFNTITSPLSAVKDSDIKSTEPLSSCLPDTVLEGLAYLKGQPPVLALPDNQYPAWLWNTLKPKVCPEDGPGGKAEKVRLRKENRQRIKDQNFMKTQ